MMSYFAKFHQNLLFKRIDNEKMMIVKGSKNKEKFKIYST